MIIYSNDSNWLKFVNPNPDTGEINNSDIYCNAAVNVTSIIAYFTFKWKNYLNMYTGV